MPQDYNVDDILDEIRRKKSRAKPSSNAPERNTYGYEKNPDRSFRSQRTAQPVQDPQTSQYQNNHRMPASPMHAQSKSRSSGFQRPADPDDPMGFGNIQPLGTRRRRSTGAQQRSHMGPSPRYAPPQNSVTYTQPENPVPPRPPERRFEFDPGQDVENVPYQQESTPFSFDTSEDAQPFVFPDIPTEPANPQPVYGPEVMPFEQTGTAAMPAQNRFDSSAPPEQEGFQFHLSPEDLPAIDDFSENTVSSQNPNLAFHEQPQPEPAYAQGDGFLGNSFAARETLDQDMYLDDLYTSPEDQEDAEKEIRSIRIGSGIKVTLTGILAILSIYLAFSLHPLAFAEKLGVPNGLLFLPPFMLPEQDMRIFLIVNLAVCVLAGIFCSDLVSRGITSLCCMRANSDSPAALAFLGVLIQGILLVIFPDTITQNPSISLYFPVAVLILWFSAYGHRMQAVRIERNFTCMTSEKPKYSLSQIQNREFAREFSRGLGPDVDRIAYSAQSSFFSGFDTQSHSSDYSNNFSRLVSPICFIGAILVGVLTYLLAKDPITAVTASTAILCICAPFSSTIIPNVMLSKMSKRLTKQDAVLTGYDAAEELSETGAVIISDKDLFPEENVMLHGMKVFAEKRIDEAILDAASVILSCNGVLSGVFLNMIGGNRHMLKQVDNLTYEDSMGISAWVDGKRVLIGNSQLMHYHQIECPSRDFESRYVRDGRQILYLANSGELTAMFVVSYNADPDTAEILNDLERHGVFASVYTNDPNITSELISMAYGVKKSSVRILPANIHSEYKELVRPKERIPAKGIHAGGLSDIQMLIKSACAVRRSVSRSTIVQLIGIIVGYGLVAFMAFSGSLSSAPFQTLILYHLSWLIISWIASRIVKW